MSAYAHQMEREFSVQSLSNEGGGSGTEVGSSYFVESGFNITSFAATIFIAALITVGLLLVTLLIALAVMLRSCQKETAGIVELQKLADSYSYCSIFAHHAELNGLEPADFPTDCRLIAYQYVERGQYAKELKYSVKIAENYFNNLKPLKGGQDVVLLDIDDLLPSGSDYVTKSTQRYPSIKCFEEAVNLKKMLLLKLFTQLRVGGWSVILLSRRPEIVLNSTKDHLYSAGLEGWSSLIMRIDEESHISSRDCFSRRRISMQNEGHHISAIISSQMDVISGPCLGHRIFKLPNLVYYEFVNPIRDADKSGYKKTL